MFPVILDTNVLWSSRQRDFFLSLAAEGLYRPLWSTAILEELHICEVEKLVRRGTSERDAEQRATWLISQMSESFSDSLVTGWEGLDGSFGLPDLNDEHLLAAAVVGGAGAIVTLNAKDLPLPLIPEGIEVLSPIEFATSTTELDPFAALRAVEVIAQRTGTQGPSLNVDQLLDLLVSNYGFDSAVETIRNVRT